MKTYAFGADVGGTTVKIGLFTTDGTLLEKWEIPTRTENNGEEIMLAFNFRYVEEPLKLMEAERVAFDFKDANKAAILRTEPKSDYFHVIMTMNLN